MRALHDIAWSEVRQKLDELTAPKVQCTKCKRFHPGTTEYFAPNAKKRNGLESWCRDCQRERARERMRERRADPIERVKVLDAKRRHLQSPQGREWKRRATLIENHKRRQKHIPGAAWNWSYEAWQLCLEYWGCCAYCGVVDEKLEQDHYVPIGHLAFPGTVPTNMVPACARCNELKLDRHPDDVFAPPVRARIAEYFEALR